MIIEDNSLLFRKILEQDQSTALGARYMKIHSSFLSRVALSASLAALMTFFTPGSAAQVLYGTLVGSISDASGAAVAGAEVTVSNAATGQVRTVLSQADGSYNAPNLQGGDYTIDVKLTGFKTVKRTSIQVAVNSIRREDFRLEVGEVTQEITVEGSAMALQTEKADVSSEISASTVNNLPIGGYRNYQSLINLVPGATPAAFQNAAITRPGRALTTNVNGTNRNNNVTKLDGAVNISTWLPHHVAYVAPSETIETVNITTNNFDAEQGLAGGAAVTVVTKSGTNDLHGSLFGYHDNQHLRAWGFFETRSPNKPKSIRNIDGFTLGGPIKRDKLFFFGDWESTRERVNRYGLFTVPTADQREGNFSAYNTKIYDPATGSADGKGRQLFAGNIIPKARQSAIAQKIVSLVPTPTQGGVAANFYNSDNQKLDRDQFDIKTNWNRTASHSLWAKYSFMRGIGHCNPSLGSAGGSGLCDTGSGTGYNRAQLASVGHTWVASSTVVVDGVIGFTRNLIDVTPPNYGKNIGLETWGIPGTNGPDIRQSGMPIIAIGGYTSLGDTDSWNPAFQRDQNYNITTNVGWLRGKHDIRFGFDGVRHYLNHWQPELGSGPRGGLTFGAGPTALNGGSATNQFNSYATFLLGLQTAASKSVQWESMNTREWQMGFYVRDRWQVTSRTTLVAGLRYELFPLLSRAHTGIEFYDPATNIQYRGGLGGNPTDLGIATSKKLFAPRLGITHRITSKTVIRAGYGLTYNPMVLSRPFRGSYPMTIDASFTSPNSYSYFATLDKGIPLFTGEDPTAGSYQLPTRFSIRSLWRPDGERRVDRGYIQSWNLILERELPGGFVASAGYVATKTVKSFVDWEANNAPPGTGRAGQPFNQKYGRTASTLFMNGWADGNYHSLQTTLNRSFRGGLMLKGAYTWSKAMDMQDDDGWGGLLWNWAPVIGRNYARSGFDIPHNLQMGFAYELPFGKGKPFLTEGLASAVLGGWQANGIFYAFKGRPFTVSAPGTSLNAVSNSQTADQVKSTVEKLNQVGPGGHYFDPTAFKTVTDVRFGTSGRNLLRAPGVVGIDASIYRRFRITERFLGEFRAESFNLTNTPQFGRPNADASSANFMKVLSAGGQRQFRFGLRLEF